MNQSLAAKVGLLIPCENCHSLAMQLKGYERIDDDGRPTPQGERIKAYYACDKCRREIEKIYSLNG